MTALERENILAKEILTIEDICKLMSISYEKARQVMVEIKHSTDRLKIAGILHIQDYIDYYKLDVLRFTMPKKERPYEVG